MSPGQGDLRGQWQGLSGVYAAVAMLGGLCLPLPMLSCPEMRLVVVLCTSIRETMAFQKK